MVAERTYCLIFHFPPIFSRTPEPVQFVDLSTYKMIGDLPSENIARVKISDKNVNDSLNLKIQKSTINFEEINYTK